MGGIKNKLSKLSNKVKTLLSSLSLTERADERSSSGEVKTNKTKGSRLPSFSQPSKMPDGQISNTRKLSHLGLYAEKTIGSLRPTSQSLPLAKGRQMSVAHRWGRITKYLGIACLTLAILSTLVLNIISSYSNSSTRSNAEPVSSSSISTLADNNTTSISLSFSPISTPTSSPDTSNPANVSMQIPDGGEIATGGHTVEVSTGSSVIGYELQLASDNNETGLVNNEDSNNFIPTTAGTIASPTQLADKTYGYTLTDLDNNSNLTSTPIWVGLQPNANPATIATIDDSGVNIQNPVKLIAGDYSRGVVYTVAGKIAPMPDVSSATPIEYPLNNKVTSIDNSNIDLFAVTADGSVYRYNQYSSKWSNVASPMCKVVKYHYAPYDTSVGYSLCQDGRLYVWGNNDNGGLGIGNTESVDAESPIDISDLLEGSIRSVSISSFSIALTDNGQVYAWGNNSDGQLGVGDFGNRLSPVNITDNFSLSSDDRVIAICTASHSVFALTEHGRVFSWGTNFGGQLGNGDSSRKDQPLPIEITDRFSLNSSSEKVIDLQAVNGSVGGTAHVLALTNVGRVFAWGINEYGQLGDGSGGTDSVYGGRKGSPVDITDYFNLSDEEMVKRIMVGLESSSYATTNFGRIFGWGAWHWSRTIQTTPIDITGKIPSSNLVQFVYNYPVYALDDNGKIYASSKEDAGAAWSLLPDPGNVSPNITLTGSNFTNVNNVYIDLNADGTLQSNEQCTNLTVNSDAELTCNVPTDNNIATGDYTMYIETPYMPPNRGVSSSFWLPLGGKANRH